MSNKIIVGVKHTHDGAVAAVDAATGQLLFCHEMEKRFGQPRYSSMLAADQVLDVLAGERYRLEDVHTLALDGWKSQTAATAQGWQGCAGYDSQHVFAGRVKFGHSGAEAPFISFSHLDTHIAAATLTAPHSAEPHHVVVWDGGMPPRVFFVNPLRHTHRNHTGDVHAISGTIYGLLAERFGPYKGRPMSYDTPGKLMSYLARGQYASRLAPFISEAYEQCFAEGPMPLGQYPEGWLRERLWCALIDKHASRLSVSDEDALVTVDLWLTGRLLSGVRRFVPLGAPLTFTGGCALNIRWNAALRALYPRLHVPPFPNDSGNAIGAAWCAWRRQSAAAAVAAPRWGVYSGPALFFEFPRPQWRLEGEGVRLKDLAVHFASKPDEPVIVLIGRAELGPRALGHRSIIAAPAPAVNKDLLNALKRRESFRPVAPMCLEERAQSWFSPGTPDPWMLFTHKALRPELIPAGIHEDGTARLQTVSAENEPELHALLQAYERLTGTPILLNTSANENGAGFFHDLWSAQLWAERSGGCVKRVFCNGRLYTLPDKQ